MDEPNVLSTEEVEALIKAAQTASLGADEITEESTEDNSNINTHALTNILENTRSDFENKLTVLLRKKIAVRFKPPVLTNATESTKEADEIHTYTSIKVMPYDDSIMVALEFKFLDLAINLLYGGKIQEGSTIPTSVGKIGVITAEKVSNMLLESLQKSCKDHATITYENYKTSTLLKNSTYFNEDEQLYLIQFEVTIDEIESKFQMYIAENILNIMLPVKTGKGKHRDSDFWRTAIKSEVIDSNVTITTNIADVRITVKDFMNLKDGDEIPIGDPTLVFVCMNNLKLFRALAGQSNSKIVAKIVGQI
jgi:flagellar motor switch protein FliM